MLKPLLMKSLEMIDIVQKSTTVMARKSNMALWLSNTAIPIE